MDARLEVNKNLFVEKELSEIDKATTYAKIIDKNGKAFIQFQFEIRPSIKDKSTSDENLFRDTLESGGSILEDNSYETGSFLLEDDEGNITIKLQIATKRPGGSSHG